MLLNAAKRWNGTGLKQSAKIALSALLSVSATAALALDVCDKPYWPYSEFIEAPAPFRSLLEQWPEGETLQTLVAEHHDRISVEFRHPIGPCQPTAVPRFLDAMFGGLFNRNEEERLRAINGYYEAFSRSCRIVNWENIEGSASNTLGRSPHVLRYGNAKDPMCGPNPIFLTAESGLVAAEMTGASCDIGNFQAERVRAISLNSIFSGVHSGESIVERLYDYIGEGDAISLRAYGRSTPDHAKLAIAPLAGAGPMFPKLFQDAAEPLPFGRIFEGRYYLIYPTINNARGEANRYFPTFTSSLRIDIVDVTDGEPERRYLRDACFRNQENTDQPILQFQ